jgi:hypothetical protein
MLSISSDFTFWMDPLIKRDIMILPSMIKENMYDNSLIIEMNCSFIEL